MGWAVKRELSDRRFVGWAVLKDHLSAQWFWEVRQLICPTTFATSFIQVGLAHALAASGFQTSLILGLVLAAGLSPQRKLAAA